MLTKLDHAYITLVLYLKISTKLNLIDPSGTLIQYEAKGIGAADEGIKSILHEQYKPVYFIDMTCLDRDRI